MLGKVRVAPVIAAAGIRKISNPSHFLRRNTARPAPNGIAPSTLGASHDEARGPGRPSRPNGASASVCTKSQRSRGDDEPPPEQSGLEILPLQRRNPRAVYLHRDALPQELDGKDHPPCPWLLSHEDSLDIGQRAAYDA